MSPSHLIRLSGLTLVAGCMLFVIAQIIRAYALFSPTGHPTAVGLLVGPIALLAGPLVVLGLIGVYARQLESAGILKLIAFLITFFGSAFAIGAYWYATFVAPSIAPAQAPLHGSALIVANALLHLGWLLIGVSLLRGARLFPRSAAVLLIVVSLAGGLVSVVQPQGGLPEYGGVLSYASVLVNVLFYAVVAWLGLTLWSRRSASEGPARKAG